MAETFTLTEGALERIHNASGTDDEALSSSPTVQILTLKKFSGREGQSNPNAPDRYRLILSDGKNFAQAMLATQLSHLVDENQLKKGCIITLDKVTCNALQGKKLIILLQVTIISSESYEKIGNPVNTDAAADSFAVTSPGSAGATTPAVQPQQQPAQPPRAQPQQYQEAARQPAAGGSRAQAGGSPRAICPIESLSPYQTKWEVRARVLFKSELRHWSNNKGTGKVFNVTLGDESGEINATGFNAAADAFYDKLQKDKVYYVSKGRINIAKNKKFSNVANEYEIVLDERNTIIEECMDSTQMPAVRYNLTPLSELENRNKDDIIDVMGIVKDVSEVSELTSKTGKQFTKRELTLVDHSGYSVRLTLFGKQAEEYSADSHPVIAFRGVKVGDFGGRSLSTMNSSSIDINPDIPEAFSLKGWFDNEGQTQAFNSYSNGAISSTGSAKFDRSQVRTIADVKDANLGESDQPNAFACRATIVHIKTDNLAYPACRTESCNKKVTQTSEGWTCEKCNQSWDRPEYRYMISMSVADHTGQAWLSGFNDVGVAVFGKPADDMMALKESDESAYLSAIHKAACHTFNFSCRARIETYNDISRTRFSITKILPLNFKEEATAMRDLLFSDWAK